MQKYRLKDSFEIHPNKDYDVVGEPADVGSARQLAQEDRYQFQWWACGLINAKPLGGDAGGTKGKKGRDRGVDGVINFIDDARGSAASVLVQVKSGHVKSGDIRDLRGVLERENAAMGIYITLEPPTKDMEREALAAGYHQSALWQQSFPENPDCHHPAASGGQGPLLPPSASGDFKKAEKIKKTANQGKLDL